MLKSVLIQSSLYRVRHCYTTLRWHSTDSVSSVTANMMSRWHYRQLLFGFIVVSWCRSGCFVVSWYCFRCATINPQQDSVYTFSTRNIAHVKVHSVALSGMLTCTLHLLAWPTILYTADDTSNRLSCQESKDRRQLGDGWRRADGWHFVFLPQISRYALQ